METTGIELITQERKEQIEKHKRTVKYDIKFNKQCELIDAVWKLVEFDTEDLLSWDAPKGWSQEIFDKMMYKTYKERLIIAGALIAAEIDRIQ